MEARAALWDDSCDFTLVVNAASSGPFLQAPSSAARQTATAAITNCRDILGCMNLSLLSVRKNFRIERSDGKLFDDNATSSIEFSRSLVKAYFIFAK
jgi:hypothetical protein